MNIKDINEAILMAQGYKKSPDGKKWKATYSRSYYTWRKVDADGTTSYYNTPPCFCDSLDLMYHVNKSLLRTPLFSVWAQHLVDIVIRDTAGPELDITDCMSPVEICGMVVMASAMQLAEAFLRTHEKWVEAT